MLNSFPRSSSGCSAILQWEVAGTTLLTALTDYANSCLSLGINFKQEDPHTLNVATQIDSALEIHAAIISQLQISAASLACTRNRLISPLNRVPEKVFLEIFLHHVYDSKTRDVFPSSYTYNYVERSLWQIYRRRHNLLSVCSFWRSIISTRAEFWSIIPVSEGLKAITREGFDISLQRTRGTPLHLAVERWWEGGADPGEVTTTAVTTSDTISGHVIDALSDRIPRVDLLSICSNSLSVTRRVLTLFIQKGTSRLSRLSLCEQGSEDAMTIPRRARTISSQVTQASTPPPPMNTLTELLPALWIDSTYFHWDPTCAKNLVDLRIENLIFGTSGELLALVGSISLAPQLRELKMDSVNCVAPRERTTRKIRFPNLQSLTLNDLYLNVLEDLFTYLDHEWHHFALGLTYHSICYKGSSFHEIPDEECYAGELLKALGHVRIDSLMLDEDMQDILRDHSTGVFGLLECLPELQTLVLTGWTMRSQDWEDLVHPDIASPEEDSEDLDFPRLAGLSLTSSWVIDEGGLIDVVRSHQLKTLELGARRYDHGRVPSNPRLLKNETMNWLQSEVEDFRLVDFDYIPPAFSLSCRDLC